MGNIGTSITDPIPAVGTAGTTYASQLVAFLTEVKNRLEAKVPFSSIVVGLFDMANNALKDLSYLGLHNLVSAPTTPVGSIQRFSDNLYWVGASGAVRITNGASLDAAALKGITGDYGSPNPAELKFVDANAEYYAYDNQSTGAWAYFAARAFDVYGSASGSVRARLTWAGSSSYTITLPVAAPGTAAILQMDTAGAITASNTITEDVTLSSTKNLILSGTGRVKHGTYKVPIPIVWNAYESTTGTGHVAGSPGAVLAQNTVTYFPLASGVARNSMPKGFEIKNSAAPTGTITYEIVLTNGGSWLSSGTSVASTSATPSATGDIADYQADGKGMWLKVTVPNTGGATVTIETCTLLFATE